MKTTRDWMRDLAASLILTLALAAPLAAFAAPMDAKVELKGMLGQAQFSRGGGPFQAVTKGVVFQAGDILQTAGNSALDLDLGAGVGTVRLTQSTTLVFERFSAAEASYQVSLFLRDGEILGRVAHPLMASRFEVKVNSGIGAVVDGQFRLNSKGYLVLLDGKGGFVHVPPGGEPVAHAIHTPPAQSFSPMGGVHAAPAELIKEVNNQFRSKLPKP
ncbi:MAG: hypothetical protein QOF48_3928 [Verrucomicrobiota bacterium]|jgi:hypothetical protein